MAKAFKKNTSLHVNEPPVQYKPKNTGDAEPNILDWLGGKRMIRTPVRSDFDLFTVGAEGIPKSSVDELAAKLGISRKSLAEDVFDLSVKTIERKDPTERLDKRTSSHALEIAKLLQHALSVFEDEEKVKRWMNNENRALKGQKPVQFLGTLTGLTMINDVLGRIEEGVYS